MSKEFDALVFIGRFQPFHKGHEIVVSEGLKRAKEVIVIVGSSFSARDIRNPFTFEERRDMIRAAFPSRDVKIVPVADYPYDDTKWIASVQSAVYASLQYTPDPIKIGLIGHSKDHTSFYLKIFPKWGHVEVDNVDGINATDIRNDLFSDKQYFMSADHMSTNVLNTMTNSLFKEDDWWPKLKKEFKMIEAYKDSWKSAPYAPTFVTVDVVVVQSGHVLLVERNASPGMGLMALPGGFLNQEERLLDGAIRELREETKLKVPVPVLKGSIKGEKIFDAPHRSTRGRTVTTAFHIDLGYDVNLPKVKGSDDAKHAMWVPFNEVKPEEMFEDHAYILDHFLNIL